MAVGLHMQVVYTRTRSTGTEDVAVTTHDFWSDTLSDFSTTHMQQIFDAWHTFWTTGVGSLIAGATVVHSLRFWDDYNGDGSPGEVDHVITSNTAGASSAAMLPPQIACSITELLGPESRRHWGRFYLPGLATNAVANDGTWTSAATTAIATAANVLYDAWRTPDYRPCVFLGGVAPGSNALPVVEIRVDNIPDVIRRRRYQNVTQRITHSVD